MVYAQKSWNDKTYEPGSGIVCTSPQFAKTMSEFCSSLGDCGASPNLVNEFTNAGFRLQPTQELLTRKNEKNQTFSVYVGYDACVNHVVSHKDIVYRGGEHGSEKELAALVETVNEGEAEDVFCLYECREDKEGCDFISTINPDTFFEYYDGGEVTEYFYDMSFGEDEDIIKSGGFPDISYESYYGKESYGVYGGLIGLSLIAAGTDFGSPNANLLMGYTFMVVNSIGALINSYATLAASGVGSGALSALVSGGSQAAIGVADDVAKEVVTETFSSGVEGILLKEAAEEGAAKGGSAFSAVSGILSVIQIILEFIEFADIVMTPNPIERTQKAQTFAITSGIAAGGAALGLISAGSALASALASAASVGVAVAPIPVFNFIAVAVLFVIAVIMVITHVGGGYEEVSIFTSCEAWQAPPGGEYCTLCDVPVSEGGLAIDDGVGNILRGWECTEYKCKSLGQNCVYLSENEGTTKPKCTATAANDVNYPFVTDAYLLGNYKDLEVNKQKNAKGVIDYLEVLDEVEPYTFFEFGLELDEVGQCKINVNDVGEDYDSMKTYFPDSYFDYVHNQSWILMPNEEYNFYVRCQDKNGNYNIDAFAIRVHTSPGDDITPPLIEATSIENGAYVASDVDQPTVSLFLSEPANCKWSYSDKDYWLMEYGMSCSGIPSVASSLFERECTAKLNVSYGPNYFYFACNDAWNNTNSESYAYTLQGTEALNLDYVLPNGTIYYDYVTLQAKTSKGAEDGVATCTYNGVEFFNTNSQMSTQPLTDLAASTYVYNVVCKDVAGNTNRSTITFTIFKDEEAPEFTSLYLADDGVHYTLDEKATCQYYFEEFTYGGGTPVSGIFPVSELTTYYLKCVDLFNNEGEYEIKF